MYGRSLTNPARRRAGNGTANMSDNDSNRTTIILATVIPVVVVIAVAVAVWIHSRRRSSRLLNRGITPIADEEIESWRIERSEEKDKELMAGTENDSSAHGTPPRNREAPASSSQAQHRQNSSSVSSVQKPSSVIVYQNITHAPTRASGEHSPRSTGPASAKQSVELPPTPILARAPNARPGLTDEAVQGDDAFIPQIRRQHSRLSKSPSHQRHRSAQSAATNTHHHHQHAAQPGHPDHYQTRKSADNISRAVSGRRPSAGAAHPPRASLDDAGGAASRSEGLSPRPAFHRSEIGRAIG